MEDDAERCVNCGSDQEVTGNRRDILDPVREPVCRSCIWGAWAVQR